MKKIHETERKKEKKERKRGVTQALVNVRDLNDCAFKLCFLQLTCKASLIFKSNLELILSNILKERELCESKHVVVECRCSKI